MNGNMVTQVNPGITENEMRSFFDRLVNAMVERTKLASDVEELKVKLDETLTRVTSLVAEASNLRNNVYTLQGERDQARRESEDNKKLADMFSADLERTKASENQVRIDLVETRNNFYQAKAELEQVTKEKAMLDSIVSTTKEDRDYWRTRAIETGNELKSTTQALTETRSKLTKFQEFYKGMFAEVTPAEPVLPKYEELPGTAPKFEGLSATSFPIRPTEYASDHGNDQQSTQGSDTGVFQSPLAEPKQEETHPSSSEVTNTDEGNVYTPGFGKSQF